MFEIDSTLQKVLIIHLLVCAFFYNYKPSFMFDENNKFKSFGTGPNKTIYPFWLVTLLSGIIIYLCIIIKNNDYI